MILNIYKPREMTSFNVLRFICHITKEKKVEYGGTLDSFAEDPLIRTKVGSFSVDDSKTIDNIKTLWKS